MEMSEDATTTLLLHAAREGDLQCVRELMEADGDSSLPVYSALVLAAERGHERLVRFLLGHGADANTISDEGRTVLELAAGSGHTDVIRCLIEYGADISDADSDVWTPLVLAIENGHEETARYLVNVGADVNSTDYAGRPMLSVAVDTEQTEIVHYLVNNGAGVRMPELSDTAPQAHVNAGAKRERSSGIMPRPQWSLHRWDVQVDRAKCLGGSRSGRFYRGTWLESEVAVREVAIDLKEPQGIAHEPCAGQVEMLQRFKREAQRWVRIDHPNVVRLFGACYDDGLPPVFVCEYASNGPLDEYLKAHPEQLWAKLYEVALGVQHLHDRDVVLGDIKCSSIVVGSDMKAKVAGFRHRQVQAGTKRSADAAQWLEPEFLGDNSAHATLESDILALGMCMIEAMQIVEADMFAEESFVVVVLDEDTKQFPISTKRSAFDTSLERQPKICRPVTCTDDQWALVENMCARDPGQRFKIGDVVRAVERLQFSHTCLQQPEQKSMESLNTFNDGELMKRWDEGQRLMEDRALQGLQRHVFVDLLSIFARLQQSVYPKWLLEQVELLLVDFLREDRFLRCRILDPTALKSTNSMRVFGRRISDVLSWLGLNKAHAVSSNYSYPQIDFLVSEDLPTWLLLSEVTSDVDYGTLHSLLKAELSGNSSSYTFDQLVIIRSAYEEIDEATLLNRTESLMLRPRWFVPWSELRFAGRSDSSTITRAKWLGADVMVKRLERRLKSAKAAETTELLRDTVEAWFYLSHPNVVRLYGACHAEDPFFVCEDASNGLLNEYLREHPNQLWEKLRDAARGLRYLHERGIVHGNLQTSSIVVTADGVAKLTDIGFSAAASRAGHGGDDISGDWRWVAPECDSGKEKTLESDVFSFGVCVVDVLRAVASLVKDKEKEKEERRDPDSFLLASGLGAFLEADLLPSRPKSCRDDEWELVQKMCAFNPSERIKIGAVVDALETLSTSEKFVKIDARTKMKQLAAGPRKRSRVSESPPTELKETESKRRTGDA